jgi:hypothetical protein
VPRGGIQFSLRLAAIIDFIPPTRQFVPCRNNQFSLHLMAIYLPNGNNFFFFRLHSNLRLMAVINLLFASWQSSISFHLHGDSCLMAVINFLFASRR